MKPKLFALFLLSTILLISMASALGWEAESSTEYGDTGFITSFSYAFDGIWTGNFARWDSGKIGYVNFTKPLLSNQSILYIKDYYDPFVGKNMSFPQTCFDALPDKILFQLPASGGTGGYRTYTCYNESGDWMEFYNNYSCSLAHGCDGIYEVQMLNYITSPPVLSITINSPTATNYTSELIDIEIELNQEGSCIFSFDEGVTNYTTEGDETNTTFTSAGNFTDGDYTLTAYCTDIYNQSDTNQVSFSVAIPIIPEVSEVSEQTIYKTLEGAGAGLGIFIQYFSLAIPTLLTGLAIVGITIIIGLTLTQIVKPTQNGIQNKI